MESWKGAEARSSAVKVVITAVLTLRNTNLLKTIDVLIEKHPVSVTGTRHLTLGTPVFFLRVKRISTLFFLSRIMLNWKYSSQKVLSDLQKGKVRPCTDTEALYRPYGP